MPQITGPNVASFSFQKDVPKNFIVPHWESEERTGTRQMQ